MVQIDLQVNFDAQAGLIKNLPFLEYNYSQKLNNKEIFAHFYEDFHLRELATHYSKMG